MSWLLPNVPATRLLDGDLAVPFPLDELGTRSGVCGTLVDACRVYSDPSVGAFMHDVALKERTPR